jgi:hypothetical protein
MQIIRAGRVIQIARLCLSVLGLKSTNIIEKQTSHKKKSTTIDLVAGSADRVFTLKYTHCLQLLSVSVGTQAWISACPGVLCNGKD